MKVVFLLPLLMMAASSDAFLFTSLGEWLAEKAKEVGKETFESIVHKGEEVVAETTHNAAYISHQILESVLGKLNGDKDDTNTRSTGVSAARVRTVLRRAAEAAARDTKH